MASLVGDAPDLTRGSPPDLAPHCVCRKSACRNIPFQPQKLVRDLPRVDLRRGKDNYVCAERDLHATPPASSTHRGLKFHEPCVRLRHLVPVGLRVRVLVEHVYRVKHLLQRRLLLHLTCVHATGCSSIRGARFHRWPGLPAAIFKLRIRSFSPRRERARAQVT